MNSLDRTLLGACFFMSGATSLVLEVTWSKELSYTLGNTLYAVTTVVASFMVGLALGSAVAAALGTRITAPLRAYALIQFLIAGFAAMSIPLSRAAQPLFGVVYQATDPTTALLIRFAAVALFMIVPATLMGMTVPIVVGAYARRRTRYTFDAGLLYGVNTLGAVVGTFGAGFLLIPAFGLWRTCLAAAAVDLLAGSLALGRHSRVGRILDVGADRVPPADAHGLVNTRLPASRWTRRQWLLGSLFAVLGATAMASEVAWFRLLGLTLGPSVYAFASMLGCFLLCVGAGSVAAARWAQKTRLPGIEAWALLATGLGASVLGGLYYLNSVPEWNFRIYGAVNSWSPDWGFAWAHVAVAALVVAGPCLLMGAMFPVSVRASSEASTRRVPPETMVGRLYMLNTLGGIVGSLAAGLWLLPRLGTWRMLAGIGLLNAGVGAALWALSPRHSPGRRTALAAGLVTAVIIAAQSAPSWDTALFNQGYYREIYTNGRMDLGRLESQKLIFYREGVNSPVAVFNNNGEVSLRVMGKADASSNATDLTTQMLVGHLPVL